MTATRITDFSIWDLRNKFTEDETAHLWLGLEPNYKLASWELPNSVRAVSLALTEAKDRGALVAQIEGQTRHVYWDKWGGEHTIFNAWGEKTYYTRQALRSWAEQTGQRPLFLFPEDRPQATPSTVEMASKLLSEHGKKAASKRHANRHQWYLEAVKSAGDQWKNGSSLRHDQMTSELMKEAPTGISHYSLREKLKKLLENLDRTDLIRGFSKK